MAKKLTKRRPNTKGAKATKWDAWRWYAAVGVAVGMLALIWRRVIY